MSDSAEQSVQVLAALDGLAPSLSMTEQCLAIQLYRRLAGGKPVTSKAVGADVQLTAEEADQILDRWYGVFRDENARVIEFWGLSLQATRHRFRVKGQDLYTWCALDALCLPEVLQTRAEVVSTCPVTGDAIQLTVAPSGIEQIVPAAVVVSLVAPGSADVRDDIVSSFCRYVQFLGSAAAGSTWVAENEGTFLVPVEEAYALGRKKNASRFGSALNSG